MAADIHRLKPNTGKKLKISVGGHQYARYPVKTHVVCEKDNISSVVEKYAGPYLRGGDMIVMSERVVAITQGRAIPIAKIKPTLAAKILVKFVYKPSWGIGIGSPWTMQVAIDEAGLGRIFLAGVLGTLGKIVGMRGVFYKVVGNGINAIDGPTSYTLPPGNKCATLGPKDPEKVVREIQKAMRGIGEIGVVIIDANDIGARIEGATNDVDRKLVCKIFRDNPLGQAHEQTPMAIVRMSQKE